MIIATKRWPVAMALVLGLMAAAALAVVPALAEKPAGDKAGHWFRALDKDGDGAISRDEARARGAKRFGRLDADGDGKVSREEFLGRHQRRFAGLDADGDGAVTRDEFDARSDARFEKIDQNGDGRVTLEELREARKSHHRGQQYEPDRK